MKRSIFSSILFTALLVISACSFADGFHVELAAGPMNYSLRSDGTWYQLGMQHSLETRGHAYKLGWTGDAYATDDWGMAWHVDYVQLGQVRSECACTTIDADYDMKRHVLRAQGYTPIARYSGHGDARGVLLSLAPYATLGDWRIGAEAGLFPYRPNYQMTVYDWHLAPNDARITGAHNTPHAWQLGGMVGAFVQWRRVALAYEVYRLPTRFDDTHNPAIWTGAHMLLLSYEL